MNTPPTSPSALPALRIGGVYDARVAERIDGGRVLLEISGCVLLASWAKGLASGPSGGLLHVEVMKIVPDLILRVVGRGGHE